jgi:threonine/homoserine/homoserine lactone efflux protein
MGAAIGNSTHAAAAGLGVALLVSRSPALLAVIRVSGGACLGWLGAQSLRRIIRGEALPVLRALEAAGDDRHDHHALREGIAVNLLNPAIITFYLAVVPTFVPAGASSFLYAALAATHVGMAFVVHCAWAYAFDGLRPVVERSRVRLALEGVTAAALLFLAVRVLLAG